MTGNLKTVNVTELSTLKRPSSVRQLGRRAGPGRRLWQGTRPGHGSSKKCFLGGTRGDCRSQGLDLSQLPVLTWGACDRSGTVLCGDAHCVSSEHSQAGALCASICRVEVGIQPRRVVPALRWRPPVRLHGPVYPVPAPRTRLPVHLPSPVRPVPVPRTRPPVCLPSLVALWQLNAPGF